MNNSSDFAERQTLLIVDDTPDNITLLSSLLKNRYRIKVATHGERALKIAAMEPPPDLILLDIMMPGMDGYEVCQRLKTDPGTAEIPVIFLTAKAQVEDEEKGLKLGAVDYITKPISPPVVLARVETHLALKNARQFLKDRNAYLEEEVRRRTREVVAIQDGQVRIKRTDGKEFTLPVTTFVPADQAYLQQWKPAAASTPPAAVPGKAAAAPANAREAAAAKVKELPNGDVLIPDDTLPEMPEAGDDDPQALSLCQFLVKYYAWKADPAEAMKGTERLDHFEKHEAALKKLVKLAGSRMKKEEKFDFNDVKRELAKGRVVAVICECGNPMYYQRKVHARIVDPDQGTALCKRCKEWVRVPVRFSNQSLYEN